MNKSQSDNKDFDDLDNLIKEYYEEHYFGIASDNDVCKELIINTIKKHTEKGVTNKIKSYSLFLLFLIALVIIILMI
ncbi:MAG: hypothetical protein ACRCTJ_01295 [Brevinema sp.]